MATDVADDAASSTRSARMPTASSPSSTRSTTSTSRATRPTLELEPIYERHEELTRLETAQRLEGAPTELWRFACEGYLGGLTREHARRSSPRPRPTLEASDRRRADPVPDAARRDGQRARPRPARAARARAPRAARRAAEPALPRRGPDRPGGGRAARRRRTTTSSTSASASGSTSSPPSARRCSTRPSASGRRPATGSSASGSGSASPMPAPPTSPRLFRAPELDASLPLRPDAARRSRRRSQISGSTSAPRRTSTSTSSSARARARAHSARRSRCPGKVMLVIQPIGGYDDWARALPRGRAHRALREHLGRPADGGEAPRRHGGHRGLGGAHRAPRRRARLAEPPPRRRRESAAIANAGAISLALLRAPLQREAPLRDRVLPGRRSGDDAAALRRAADRRAEAPREPRELPRRHRRRRSTSPATCAPGRSRRSCATSCAPSSATTGSRGARPATCSASSGRSARDRRPRSCSPTSTGARLEMAVGRRADPRGPRLSAQT